MKPLLITAYACLSGPACVVIDNLVASAVILTGAIVLLALSAPPIREGGRRD